MARLTPKIHQKLRPSASAKAMPMKTAKPMRKAKMALDRNPDPFKGKRNFAL